MEGQTEHIMLTLARRGSGKSHSTGAILQPFTNLEEEEKRSFDAKKKENKKRKKDKKAAKKNAVKRNGVRYDEVLIEENIQDDDKEDEENYGPLGDGEERPLFHKKIRMVDQVNNLVNIITILIIYDMFR